MNPYCVCIVLWSPQAGPQALVLLVCCGSRVIFGKGLNFQAAYREWITSELPEHHRCSQVKVETAEEGARRWHGLGRRDDMFPVPASPLWPALLLASKFPWEFLPVNNACGGACFEQHRLWSSLSPAQHLHVLEASSSQQQAAVPCFYPSVWQRRRGEGKWPLCVALLVAGGQH